jgi:hypothetical protein
MGPKTDLCQSRSSAAEQFMPAEQFRLKPYFAQWTLFKKYQFNFLIVLVVCIAEIASRGLYFLKFFCTHYLYYS